MAHVDRSEICATSPLVSISYVSQFVVEASCGDLYLTSTAGLAAQQFSSLVARRAISNRCRYFFDPETS